MDDNISLPRHRQKPLTMLTVSLLLLVSLLPLYDYAYFSLPLAGVGLLFKILLLLIPLAAIACCYRIDIGLPVKEKITLFILLAGLGALLVDIHLIYIDIPGHLSCQLFSDIPNAEWQRINHTGVMELNPAFIPHSYRFLPDSMVSLLTFLNGDYDYAKLIYRETFMFLLLFAIYYYSRLYARHAVAIVTVLFYAVVYQISLREYAGQLTDPLSHLSFVLAFIFIELDLFAYLAMTIIFGILAKETLLVMALYAVIHKLRKRESPLGALLLLLIGFGIIVAIRRYVVTNFQMENINSLGAFSDIIRANIGTYYIWWRHLLFTAGIFIPFVIAAWKQSAANVKYLVLYLLPVLLVAHGVAGFIKETRNLIPVVIPMALLTANYLLASLREGKE